MKKILICSLFTASAVCGHVAFRTISKNTYRSLLAQDPTASTATTGSAGSAGTTGSMGTAGSTCNPMQTTNPMSGGK